MVDGLVPHHLAILHHQDTVQVRTIVDVIEVTKILIARRSLVEWRHMVGNQDDQTLGIELD